MPPSFYLGVICMVYYRNTNKNYIFYKNERCRKWKTLILAVLLILAGILPACSIFPQEDEVLAPPLVKPRQDEYRIYKVKRNTIVNKVQVTGHLVSAIDYSLSFEKGGRLDSVMVKNGDKIVKGQALVKLTAGDLETQIELAKLEVKKVELELKHARTSLNTTELLQKIQERPANSPDILNARYIVERAELDMEAAQMNLKNLEKNLLDATMKSPIDGIVTFVDVKLKRGDFIQPYQVIVQLADPDALQIMFDSQRVNNAEIIKPGMGAELTFGTVKTNGKVVSCPYSSPEDSDRKDGKDDNAIILEAEKLPEDIKMGDSIDIGIILEKKENVLTIPLDALRSYMGRNYVYLLVGNSRREANVEIGIKSATEIEIISGLNEGQQVILR